MLGGHPLNVVVMSCVGLGIHLEHMQTLTEFCSASDELKMYGGYLLEQDIITHVPHTQLNGIATI